MSYHKLYYQQPADCFEQAFVLGNGRLGATIHGGTEQEIIHLNEDTFWSGNPQRKDIPDSYRYLEQAKQLVADGENLRAQELLEQEFQSDMTSYYLPLADLHLEIPEHGTPKNYRRMLDLDTAISTISYTLDHVEYERTVFASYPDQVVSYTLRASKPGMVTFALSARSYLRHSISAAGNQLVISIQAPNRIIHDFENPSDENCYCYEDSAGMNAQILMKVRLHGGTVKAENGKLLIFHADEAELFICANTSFAGWNKNPLTNGKDYSGLNHIQMDAALQYDHTHLTERHIADYKELFGRFFLDLGSNGREHLPTDQRLTLFAQDQQDAGLYTLLCQFGRYLAISSSREGTQPANLQGIWNHRKRPPWRCGLTTNINLQMNYWPLAATGLGRCVLPLVTMLEECAVAGKSTAEKHYHSQGFVIHHNTDLWRATWPMGRGRQDSAAFGFWNMGGVWLQS